MNLLQISIRRHKGFTLIEIIIVMAIFSALAAIGTFFNFSFYGSSSLQADADIFTSSLQRARSRAVNNINESRHGLYIDSSEYILFQGDSFVTRNPSLDEPVSRNPNLIFIGPTAVVFSQLSGDSSFQGDIVITSGFKTATVSLNYAGRINR